MADWHAVGWPPIFETCQALQKRVSSSTDRRSGRRTAEIRRKNAGGPTESDYDHMRKVRGYVECHLAQKLSGDIEDSAWRYSLMNWGHDPCKHTDC